MTKKYGIDLDIGIGYVGFAVHSNVDDNKYIEDLGIRFFNSGETANHKAKNSEVRRAYRNARRVLRRRTHRKDRVKAFLQKIGFLNLDSFKAWQEKNGNQNVFDLRFKGLFQKLTPEELTDCIIHICNHRGYSEYHNEAISAKEVGLIKTGLESFEEVFNAGNYRSVADMVLHDELFQTETTFPDYHNHKNNGRYVLIKRSYIRKELLAILKEQSKYYPQLTKSNIDFLCDKIVFAQRDFENGPGDENDKTRKFMGYLDSVGKCIYYKEEKRAFRSTVLADVFILVNRLSRYKYVDAEGKEVSLSPEVASTILNEALLKASISEKAIKVILKGFGLELKKNGKKYAKLTDTLKTLKIFKSILEASGYDYQELVAEEYFKLDAPSDLQKLGVLLSENVTPKRREKVLKAAGWNETFRQKLVRINFGGTIKVCERYMADAVNAFLNGEAYNDFKAKVLKERRLAEEDIEKSLSKHKTLPVLTKKMDEEIAYDIVGFKSVNEARKIVNAIIGKHGSPSFINVVVAERLQHINRYVANYLKRNLLFDSTDERYVRIAKGNIASKMRKAWVNGEALEEFSVEPLISYKQNKKFQGQITADNPIAKEKFKESSIVKIDTLGNENVLSAKKYYCVEIYKNAEQHTKFRGLRYVDFKKQDKKLYLTVPYPEDYLEHVMYLFQNDYIKIFDGEENLKFAGYYRSVRAVMRSLLNLRSGNSNQDFAYYVTRKDVFKKYAVDVLGNIGGEVKCSVLFMLLPNKNGR